MNDQSQRLDPPHVRSETWQQLVAAAGSLRRLSPWKQLYDSNLFGIQDPATGKVRLASILGRNREVFALVVFRGQDGVRWIMRMAFEESPICDNLDWGLSQNCLKVEFVSRQELAKEDLAVLRQAGYKPKPRMHHAWPIFRSHISGCFPWFLDQAEAETLLGDLQKAVAFAQLMSVHPSLFENRFPNEIPFFPAQWDFQTPLEPEHLAWHSLAIPPEPPPETVQLPKAERKELNSLPQREELCLEVDSFYAPGRIMQAPRPWYPKMMLAVDARTGYVVGMNMGESKDLTFHQIIRRGLTETFRTLDCRPGQVHVIRPELELALTPMMADLDILLLRKTRLPMLEEARETMRRHFGIGA